MKDTIGITILCVLAIVSLIISYRQFKEKGFLFNNAYIFESKEQRESMDKKPHYKQSGIVFLLIGILWMLVAVDILLKTSWLFYCELVLVAFLLVYAIVSSVKIEKNEGMK